METAKNKHFILPPLAELGSKNMEILGLNMEIYIMWMTNKR